MARTEYACILGFMFICRHDAPMQCWHVFMKTNIRRKATLTQDFRSQCVESDTELEMRGAMLSQTCEGCVFIIFAFGALNVSENKEQGAQVPH